MIADLILVPVALGVGLSLATRLTPHMSVRLALIALGVLLLTLISVGVPPFPPVASKHKIVYLVLVLVFAAPAIGKSSAPARFGLAAIYLLGAFLWLNWRRFVGGMPSEPLLLSVITIAAVLTGAVRSERVEQDSLLWPASLFVTVLAFGLVGLLSGFLGLGQLAVGVGVFLGGVLLPPFVETVTSPTSAKFRMPPALPWLLFNVLGLLGISLASFATNLHPFAYCLLLLALLSPLIAVKTPKIGPAAMMPVVFGVVAAIPAGGATLVAFLHF